MSLPKSVPSVESAMRPMSVWLSSALILLLSPLAFAGSDGWRLQTVLDTRADDAQRIAQVERLRADADAGSHAARCTLGRVGLQKRIRPRDFPDTDFGDPAAYLGACVLGGDLDAMLVMAEMELHQRRALEAMIWMQTYIKLAAFFGSDEVNSAGSYKVGLLQRIERAYSNRRPSNEEVLEYVAGVIDSHGERIVTGCETGGCGWVRGALPPNAGPLRLERGGRGMLGRFTRDTTSAEDTAMYATFLVEVGEDGRPAQVMALDSFPDGRAVRQLGGSVRAGRYNAVEPGTGPRYALVPVFVDIPDFKLMPDAPPGTRNRVRG
jgi:hypothetical protein